MSHEDTPDTPDKSASDDSLFDFPCEFPIKAMGKADDSLESVVLEIVRRHVPDLPAGALKTRLSSNGKYLAITVTITAQSRAQLDAIYLDLSACKRVLMAL